jgi:hypothetical protein
MYKIIFRSIFYPWLILLIGISIGFITNAEWLGYKSVIIEQSISNIFFPIEFTQEIEEKVKGIGASKIFTQLGYPNNFEILGDMVYYNDEFYWCKYKYRDKNNRLKFGESTTRVKWKTWEYNYGSKSEVIDTEQKAQDAMNKLNNWHSKIREAIKKADQREQELLKQEAVSVEQQST